jgi:hypothetical protein
MKKTFVNPEMNISLFDMENVLTVSTNEAAVTADMNATAGNTTKVSLSELEFTF